MNKPKDETDASGTHFDLSGSEGANASERLLLRLCRGSFLRLWARSNIFTDEGFKNGKGNTKELCDALVVFGNDVLIFSDKHVNFQDDNDISVAWPRWYKRAVAESVRQLHGAKSWLQRFPERAYLDAKCTRKLPVPVPTGNEVRFHLIAVTRGSRPAVLREAQGEGLGSLGIDTELVGESAHLKAPFRIGIPNGFKQFVHILDEVTVELLLQELDTAKDFINYLIERERILSSKQWVVKAYGEEDLLATYLRTMDSTRTNHLLLPAPDSKEAPTTVVYDGISFEELYSSANYRAKKEADRPSYIVDKLINRFTELGDPSLHPFGQQQSSSETESGLRHLAAESRFRRRLIGKSFIEALRKVEPGGRMARVHDSGVTGEPVYIYLVVSKRDTESYEEYRKYRIALLHAYCRCAKLKAPLGTIFIGIAVDNPHKNYLGGSEDFFVLTQESWSPEQLDELERMSRELNILQGDIKIRRSHEDEFPSIREINSGNTADRSTYKEKKNKRKRMEQMRTKSRRANRKR